ncbi:putative virion structural protein [Erwinia phage vB_EamM_EarlPhillipIV]|uniref:Putative virion structural protein n=1 Tax=Erwinia phage vB_EamM_EarlPhillipIV TaxID=1883372 RepID=A0A1B2ICA8_9CAUD|nr:putative virion structural protein [Erwinia phage vB_EamM_EarlPhillipIV]ANZ48913.1 putative virion structural protein [Erwinia phage vB_EamM_EarlPhillipIV]
MFARFKSIVAKHIAKAVGSPKFTYTVVLKANGVAVKAMKVHSITRRSEFVRTIGTTTFITILVPMSQLRLLLSNTYGNLTCTLGTFISGRLSKREVLYGVVQNAQDLDLSAPTKNLSQGDDMDFSVVTLELMSETVWNLRMVQHGLNIQRNDPLTVCRFLLARTTRAQDAQKGDTEALQYAEEPQTPYASIVVPDGTPFRGIFDYLQNRYGVYSQGLGVFNYQDIWFLFKPWNKARFQEDDYRLVIYALAADDMAQPEHTFRIDGKTYYVVVAGDTRLVDQRDQSALNEGTGYRVASVRALDGRTVDLSSDGPQSTTSDAFVSASNPTPHNSKMTNANFGQQKFTDSDKALRSEFARKGGRYLTVTWSNAMFGAVCPGMGVQYNYANDGGMFTKHGTIIGEIHHTALDGGGTAGEQYVSNAEILLWIAD